VKVVVCIPWRPTGDPLRNAVWDFLHPRWEQLGWPLVFGDGRAPEQPFNLAVARNDAARNAGDWDVAVIADACKLTSPEQIREAVRVAAAERAFVTSYRPYHKLSKPGTERVLAGQAPNPRWAEWSRPDPVGGIDAIERSLWEEVNGYDEGFEGWGDEDVALVAACVTFGSRHWVDGPGYHLWHKSWINKRSPEFKANRARGNRYRAARGDRAKMRELLEELKQPAR